MTTELSPVQQIEALHQRLVKAREIVASGKVHPIVGMEDHYAVECSRIDGGMYLVNGTCTCIDAQQRVDVHHGWCKHKLSVELFKETLKEETPKPALSRSPERSEGSAEGAKPETAAPPESDRSLEDQLEDLYPKARLTDSPR